ncbi:DMT family transporter, partial [Sulfurimonas sp.]|uniref:DMT family transporter n=1 Tax=Sulfurimonas sp. TaxID=2022749 RepID=UPI0025F40366
MRIYIMLTLCVLFWSGNFVLGRYIHNELEPMQIAMFRWFGVFLVLLPFIIKKRKSITKELKQNFAIITLLSFLGIAMFNTLLYVGLQYTTATNALLINSSVPILIIIFSIIILKTTVTRFQVVGVLFSMFGVIYLALHGNISSLFTLSFGRGDIWVIASSLSWALYSV